MNFESINNSEKTPDALEAKGKLDELQILEVKVGDEGYEDALSLPIKPNETRSIKEIVAEALQYKYWFLRDYWRNKQVKETFRVRVGLNEIGIYNFGEVLRDDQKAQIENALHDYAEIQNDVLGKINSILIDDIQYANENTGMPLNGRGGAIDGAIKVYPAALEGNHRIEGVSNLEGTIIHELSHSISVDLRNKWLKEFDWENLETPTPLPGGGTRYQIPKDPSRCVTEYAQISVAEDVCESMVAYLKNPKILDPSKLRFLMENFPRINAESDGIELLQVEADPQLPKFTMPIRYKLIEPKTSNIKS